MPTTATIRGLDFVSLPTRDMERSVAFYRDLLGLEVESRFEDQWTEYKLGEDLTLAVMRPESMGRPFERVTGGTLALRVADVDAVVDFLVAQGVHFEGEIMNSGVCKMAFLSDPDGNSLMLHNRYARH